MHGSAAPSLPKASDEEEQVALLRRRLLLRDSLSFVILSAVAATLFGITLALFRSFEAHREALGRSWAQKGDVALQHGDAAAAVTDLRTALSYAPDEHANQLMLARALAGSGHLEEANNYFLNLWTTRPGDGSINLQLARLARDRGDANQAIEYYHAAIFGDWGGDGLLRRRQARLELADYLVGRNDLSSARTELLIAAGNAPHDAEVSLLIGSRLMVIGATNDALAAYRSSMTDAPRSRTPLLRAGAASYEIGLYAQAETLLHRALHDHLDGTPPLPENIASAAEALEHTADRLGDLSLSHDLNVETRAHHLLLAAGIAEARLAACSTPRAPTPGASLAPPPLRGAGTKRLPSTAQARAAALAALPPVLVDLHARWKTLGRDLRHGAEDGDASAQDGLASLIFYTEEGTATPPGSDTCGAPTGDDALLLLLAHREADLPLPAAPALTAETHRATSLALGRPL